MGIHSLLTQAPPPPIRTEVLRKYVFEFCFKITQHSKLKNMTYSYSLHDRQFCALSEREKFYVGSMSLSCTIGNFLEEVGISCMSIKCL